MMNQETSNDQVVGQINRIRELIEAGMTPTMKARNSLYVMRDERGVVFVDNYDSPYAIALIVTDEGGFVAHSCSFGSAFRVNQSQAESYARSFFSSAGDRLIDDFASGLVGERIY